MGMPVTARIYMCYYSGLDSRGQMSRTLGLCERPKDQEGLYDEKEEKKETIKCTFMKMNGLWYCVWGAAVVLRCKTLLFLLSLM